MSCPVCGTHEFLNLYSLYDDRYGYPGLFDLVSCRDCQHKFILEQFSNEQLECLYTDYYPRSTFTLKSFKSYVKRTGFRSWLDGDKSAAYLWVPREVRVLDIGCGFGQSLAYHAGRGCDVYGVEVDQNIERVADKFGFNVHVGLFDPSVYQEGYFDYITMHQVLEHFVDPVKALQGVKEILKPNGTVILTLPNANGWGAKVFGEKWINWHSPYHLQFFSSRSMKIAVKKSGLKIVKVKTVTSAEWLKYQWIHQAVCPSVNNSSVFWDPLKTPSDDEQKKIGKIVKIHKMKINHILTRVFDSIGMGDNIIYKLSNEH